MKKCQALSLVTVALLLAALAAAAGPKFAEEPGIPEGMALVYIYCPKPYYSSPVTASVLANETPVAVLAQGCYFPYITLPGSIEFCTVERSTHLLLEVEAGREYFVRIGTGLKRWEPALVSRERALPEITACCLTDAAVD